jgi:hypothetical protein
VNMKKIMLISAILIVGVLVFGAVGYASAQTLMPRFFGGRMIDAWNDGSQMMGGFVNGIGMMGGGRGARGGYGTGETGPGTMMGGGAMHDYMEEAFAEAVGLTEEEIESRFANGESFYDIALAQGFTAEQIPALMSEARSAALNQMVADGVITQAQADLMLERMASGMGYGMMGGLGGRGGFGGPGGGPGDGLLHDYMIAGFAEAFGLSTEELQARLDAGETMYQVATSLGWTQEQFFQTMQTVRTEAINQAVADGVITQEQADWMLERMNQMWENGFGPGSGAGTGNCPMGGGRFGGGRRP